MFTPRSGGLPIRNLGETDVHPSLGRVAYQEFRWIWRPRNRTVNRK